MKKITAVTLLSTIALFGCNKDDVETAAKGEAKVIAIDGITFKGVGVADGYYNQSTISNTPNVQATSGFKFQSKGDLENLGITVKSESCALLTKKSGETELCFDIKTGQDICMPDIIDSFGYRVFTIDLDKLSEAQKNDFQSISYTHQLLRADFTATPCEKLK
ncbi:hypothetical protein [Photobacterium sanguinicancri]|uniref:hypothetical protein n=1 Tax=Photobacterium sanguinicancri TaxID=875932 RepID=UPI0021C39114|nr:hypothetical protein [Photobacterium sanguinicancri]